MLLKAIKELLHVLGACTAWVGERLVEEEGLEDGVEGEINDRQERLDNDEGNASNQNCRSEGLGNPRLVILDFGEHDVADESV